MQSRLLRKIIKRVPLNSSFWIAVLFFGQGICSLAFTLSIKVPLESVIAAVAVLFAGGLVSLAIYLLNPSGPEGNRQWVIMALFYALFIFLMSSRSYPNADVHFDTSYLHPVEYLTLGLLLGRMWYSVIDSKGFLSFSIRVLLAGALFGASDEIHQAFIPGRDCDFVDFLFDVGGTAAAILLIALIRRVIDLQVRINSEALE